MGRQLLLDLGPLPVEVPLLMDRAYEGDETRQLVMELTMFPVVPPKSNRRDPWDYDRELYKKRNEVERLFRRLEGFRSTAYMICAGFATLPDLGRRGRIGIVKTA